MRMVNAVGVAALLAAGALALPVRAQEVFDACEVFTQPDAEKALGTTAAPEAVNPKLAKAKRPKVVTTCTYEGFRDGKPVAATVQFRFGRTDAEAQQSFDEARLQFQTKPLLISGSDAFWSGKTGQMNLRKGRTWVTLSVGPDKVSERDIDAAKKLAEILVQKL